MAETYSFMDFVGTYSGPEGVFDLTAQDVASEGVTIAFAEDQATMTMGANGDGMHNLNAARSGTLTLRVLKTGSINAILSRIFSVSTLSSAAYGRGLITTRNVGTGDTFVCEKCGIRKFPDNVNAVAGGTNEWVFNSIRITPTLGDGNPQLSENGPLA